MSGTVVDEAGEPVIGLQLRVMKRAIVGGAVRFTQFGNQPTTDDRGVYRVSELAPGDYIVAVVTTQTTMPDSLQAAYAAASKTGGQQEFQRELDRSRGLSSGLGSVASGQRVGSWLLQTPLGFGSSGGIAAPPIQAGKVFVYPTVFYPAAPSPSEATIISLGPGEERSTIDFQLRPVGTWRVSGVLMGPNSTDSTGAFVFLGVTPGAYTIRALKLPPRPVTTSSMTTIIQTGTSTIMTGGGAPARTPIPEEPTYWASTAVTVGESDVTGLAITFSTGARLSGRIEFDGVAVKPTADRLGQLRVQVSKADGRTTSSNEFTLAGGVIDDTGNFKTYQLPAGRYVIRGPAFANWTFKGAFLGGRDVSDTPLELDAEDIGNIVLTYSDRPTEIIGTARGSDGPDEAATILVFPAQPNLWINHGPAPRRFKAVRAGANGVFRATSVPAGDYVVVGVHGTYPSEWQDPAFLRKLMALGTRTSVADGEIKSLDVTAREIK